MKAVEVKNLAPGMILSTDIKSSSGTLLLNKGTALSEASITTLKTYYIFNVYIEDDSIPEEPVQKDEGTRSQRIKASPEFKEFKKHYEETVTEVEQQMNDIVQRNQKTLDTQELLSEPLNLLADRSTLSIFDMLHNLRTYDDTTYIHCLNVSLISGIIARWCGLSEEDVQLAMLCGTLHDIGKINIPDDIIKKPGKLTEEEYRIVKNHTLEGYKVLDYYSIDDSMKYAALMHHERCDGKGYPFGLKDQQIDLFAKIVSIADVYDAMTSARAYRGPLCPFTVIDIMIAEGLQKYDTKLILTFLEHMGETYLNNRVRLSDGREGEIVFAEKNYPSKPIVRLDDDSMLTMKGTPLSIKEIL